MALLKKRKTKFPTFAVVLLAIGIIWFLNAINVIPWTNISWIPVVLIIVAVGMIINQYRE